MFSTTTETEFISIARALPVDHKTVMVVNTVVRSVLVKTQAGDTLAEAFAAVRKTFYRSWLSDFQKVIDLFESTGSAVAA